MANSFSTILPVIFAQALQTLREAAWMPRLVNTDFSDVAAGLGDTVNVTVPTAATVSDVTPGPTPVTPADSTTVKVGINLNRWRKAGYFLTDKERGEIFSGSIPSLQTEAIRALANDVNVFIFSKYTKVFGFTGTAGTTPFGGTNLADAAAVRKLLFKQVAPAEDRRLVLDPDAEEKALVLLANATLTGENQTLVTGAIGRRLGFDWFSDQKVPTHTAGTQAGAVTVNGAQAIGVGTTDGKRSGTLSVATAVGASVAWKAGDIITVAGDLQTYAVQADLTVAASSTGSATIRPALQKATAGAEAITLKAGHVVNLGFHKNAFAFAARRMASEAADPTKILSIADPVSQLVLRAELIRQNKQDYVEFDLLYGAECVREELAVRLAG